MLARSGCLVHGRWRRSNYRRVLLMFAIVLVGIFYPVSPFSPSYEVDCVGSAVDALSPFATRQQPSFVAASSRFQRVFGGSGRDGISSIIPATDGGFLLLGAATTGNGRGLDVVAIKIDAFGNPQWTRAYSGDRDDVPWRGIQTADGGFLITGATKMPGGLFGLYALDDVFVLKIRANGEVQRHYVLRGSYVDAALTVIPLWVGGYLLVGTTSSTSVGAYDVYVVNLDASFNPLWSRTYGGRSNDVGRGAVQMGDGGILLIGETESFGAGKSDIYVVKIYPKGGMWWKRTYGGVENEEVWGATLTLDGGVLLVGSTESYGVGGMDMYALKIDASGNLVWSRTYGGPKDEKAYAVAPTSDGGFVLAGYTESFGRGGRDLYLVKIDATGNMVWSRTYGGPEDDTAKAVVQTSDGGFLIGGWTKSFGAQQEDMYVVKIDANGNSDCAGEIPSTQVETLSFQATASPTYIQLPRPIEGSWPLRSFTYELSGRKACTFFSSFLPLMSR